MNQTTAARTILQSWTGVRDTILNLVPVSRAYQRIPPVRSQGVTLLVLDMWVHVNNSLGELVIKVETAGFFLKVQESWREDTPAIISFMPSSSSVGTFMTPPIVKYLNEFKAQLEGIVG